MDGRARFRPERAMQRLLTAFAVGSVAVLLGCGGGGGTGGGGITTGACGGTTGSGPTVLCGHVYRDGSTSAIAGATVTLRNISGTTVATATTDTNGLFKFSTVPSSTALFEVDAPSGYTPSTSRYSGSVYAYYLQNTAATGPCIPATGTLTAGDKDLGITYLFPDSTPPPPPSGCPRP